MSSPRPAEGRTAEAARQWPHTFLIDVFLAAEIDKGISALRNLRRAEAPGPAPWPLPEMPVVVGRSVKILPAGELFGGYHPFGMLRDWRGPLWL